MRTGPSQPLPSELAEPLLRVADRLAPLARRVLWYPELGSTNDVAARLAESGAEVEVYLATAPELEGVSGAYFDRKSKARAHDQAYDTEARTRLWQRSLALTGLASGLKAGEETAAG